VTEPKFVMPSYNMTKAKKSEKKNCSLWW